MTTDHASRVLITGPSVAGPAAASWLARAGYDVTVLERARALFPVDESDGNDGATAEQELPEVVTR